MNGIKRILFLLCVCVILAVHLYSCSGNLDAPVSATEQPEMPTPTVQPEPTPEPVDYSKDAAFLCITEIMVKNHAAWRAPDGSYPDWIEIENTADHSIDLSGWILSDGKFVWTFPETEIAAGEYLIIESGGNSELSTGFGLSEEDILSLRDPNGNDVCRVDNLSIGADRSYALGEDGLYEETSWITPGYPNTLSGYEAYCGTLLPADGPVVIYGVCSANSSYEPFYQSGKCDWIELKNISSESVNLSQYYLSDKNSNKLLWQLPEQNLAPGAILTIYCTDIEAYGFVTAPFSLSSPYDNLWLTHEDGTVIDSLAVHDVPVNGCCGRIDGQNGFFYFETMMPGGNHTDGKRRVSAQPEPSVPPMPYDGIDSMTVELTCEEGAVIYYTLDCSVPTRTNASVYTDPIEITGTTVIRAIAVGEDCCQSKIKTMTYVLNDEHTLPVLSLVIDNYYTFDNFYWSKFKGIETAATLSLFEDGEEKFCNACGVQLKGWTSRELPKKSLGVYFRGSYGDGDVNYDVFGNGISEYSSLSIRAGQDYTFSVVRNELFQELSLEASKDLLTQNGKYCALYINGRYWGLYCLKENVNEQYFAALKGVDKDTVLIGKGQVDYGNGLRDIIEFTYQNDITDKGNYDYFCSHFNVGSLIDWIIFEGYSGNSDTVNNIRYFSSPDCDDGRWYLCYFDLDWAFTNLNLCFSNIIQGAGNSGYQMTAMSGALLKNTEFREAFLTRFSELIRTTLSNEHVLQKFEELVAHVESEVMKDREKWDMTKDGFYTRVDEVKAFITDNDYDNFCIERVCSLLNVTSEERALYFGQ